MRLIQKEIDGIIEALNEFLIQNSAELRLFGSRVHDDLKGGDIDLLVLINDPSVLKAVQEKKHMILSQIKARIGDQKIDLKIALADKINNDPFLQLIYPDSISLKKWEK